MYSEFLLGINAMWNPGNSARIIRGGVIFLVVFGVLLTEYLSQKKIFKDEKKNYIVKTTILSIISGFSIVYSNDIGISSYITFSILYFVYIIFKYKSIIKISRYTISYIIISLSSLLLILLIITRGNIGSWFSFTFSTSQYQSWYYGLTEGWKSYYLYQIALTPLSFIALLLIIVNVYQIYYKLKNRQSDDILYNTLRIYILLTSFISSIMYKVMAGGISIELLALSTFFILLSYIFYVLNKIYNLYANNTKFVLPIKICIVLFCMSFIIPNFYDTLLKQKKYEIQGVYIDGLDGYLTSLGNDINQIIQYTGDEEVFSIYASVVEVIKGDFQPTGADYIIHVMGDEAREDYVNRFLHGEYKYVQTINRNYTPWELWIESSNWFFYKELYRKYTPSLTTSYSVIWEPVENENVIDETVNISIERLSDNEYKVICTTNQSTNGIADVYINYCAKYANGFLHKGVFSKQVNILDSTKNEIYHTECVNYFIPPDNTNYNIPVTIINGVGEVIIKAYPQKEACLEVKDVTVNMLLNSPFINLNVANISDVNWTKGIHNSANVILFNNNPLNQVLLNGGKRLICGDTVVDIISTDQLEEWIHVTISDNKEKFSYPNKIQVIK